MKLVYEISNVILKDPQIRKQYTKLFQKSATVESKSKSYKPIF